LISAITILIVFAINATADVLTLQLPTLELHGTIPLLYYRAQAEFDVPLAYVTVDSVVVAVNTSGDDDAHHYCSMGGQGSWQTCDLDLLVSLSSTSMPWTVADGNSDIGVSTSWQSPTSFEQSVGRWSDWERLSECYPDDLNGLVGSDQVLTAVIADPWPASDCNPCTLESGWSDPALDCTISIYYTTMVSTERFSWSRIKSLYDSTNQ